MPLQSVLKQGFCIYLLKSIFEKCSGKLKRSSIIYNCRMEVYNDIVLLKLQLVVLKKSCMVTMDKRALTMPGPLFHYSLG